MQVGVIGFGYVGSAVAWAHNDHDVIINDPQLKDSTPLSKFVGCDAVYICVPSPSTEDGHCDTSILESVLKELTVHESVPIISKVTAPPATYEMLQKQYPNLVYAPEFLTARNNIKDYLLSNLLIVGGLDPYVHRAVEIILSSIDVDKGQVLITDIKTASFYKYMMNSYLATKVTFMNDFFELAEKDNIDWNGIKVLAKHDDRIGDTHMQVPGFDGQFGWAGACFPKDVAAIIEYALDKNLEFELLQRVETINNKHRRK